MKPEYEIAYKLAESLDRDDPGWEFSHFTATNKHLDVEVWLSNGYYGTSYKIGRQREFGGVTGRSSIFGPLIPWRRRLRNAGLKARERAKARMNVPTAADTIAKLELWDEFWRASRDPETFALWQMFWKGRS